MFASTIARRKENGYVYHMNILQYDDLKNIPSSENNEELVVLQDTAPEVRCEYEKQDMVPFFGDEIYVRRSVADKLKVANEELSQRLPGSQLRVVYGLRLPQVQEAYFEKRKEEIRRERPELSQEELTRATHLFVASPDVAGHPTGGAIDITITTSDGDIDMGTRIADYTVGKKIETFCEGLTYEQKKNRALLHDVLVNQGFAPFYGEWWHFSYGDREWAAFYNKTKSLYAPIELAA